MDNKWEKTDLIGVLATKEETMNALDKENVFINKGNKIQFFIKIISLPPDDYPSPQADYVSAFSTLIEEFYFDNIDLTDEERIQHFIEAMEDKYISLNVEQKSSNTYLNNIFYNAKNVVVILEKSDILTRKEILFPIPYFQSKDYEYGFDSFLFKTLNNKPLEKNFHISMETVDQPKYVLFEENGDYKAIGPFKEFTNNTEGLILRHNRKLSIYEFDNEDYDYIIKNKNKVMFVNRLLDEKITEKFEKSDYISDEIIDNLNKKFGLEKESNEYHEEIDYNLEEKKFIKYFREILISQGLLYSDKDIINFHTSIKSSNLVVLSGMSGTGKSRLVRAYAEALNLKGQFKFISVSPGWTDETDLIGYVDTMNMVYRPGDSGLINLLNEASQNPNKFYIVCLDEMNLAKIEHYFSQFLSILEIDDKEDKRRLKLYNKDLGNRLYNSNFYEYELILKNNIRFVGTVNIDDSTHHFSNKVLDRANVINLEVLPFKQLKENTYKSKSKPKLEEYETYFMNNFIKDNVEINLSDLEIEFFEELHKLLLLVNRQIGIGPRVIKQIDKYIKNIPLDVDGINRESGIDLQVSQRILTKIRGSKEELESVIGIFDNNTFEVHDSKILELFLNYSEVSSFEESKKIIQEKAKEIYINGYAF